MYGVLLVSQAGICFAFLIMLFRNVVKCSCNSVKQFSHKLGIRSRPAVFQMGDFLKTYNNSSLSIASYLCYSTSSNLSFSRSSHSAPVFKLFFVAPYVLSELFHFRSLRFPRYVYHIFSNFSL